MEKIINLQSVNITETSDNWIVAGYDNFCVIA